MDVENWLPHIKHVLNKYGIKGRWKRRAGTVEHGFEGITIKQTDQTNCGPIASIVLWKLFRPESVHVHMDPTEYRNATIKELMRLIDMYDSTLDVFQKTEENNRKRQ